MALATATSGIAATLLPHGRTVHQRFKVPIDITSTSMCSIRERSAAAELVRRCKLLIIDEVTMAHRHVYETLDRSFQSLRKNDKPFGAMTAKLSDSMNSPFCSCLELKSIIFQTNFVL